MADVTLGRAGSRIFVDLDICVKTGQVTNQRVTLRGSTSPAWVTVLLLFTVIGFLFASVMTSRRYQVTLPFSHEVHSRWRNNRRLAWIPGLAGVGALIAAATTGTSDPGFWLGLGLALIAGALVIGTANALRNNVGIHVTRDGDLRVTRAHPAFAEGARAATREQLVR